MHWGEGDYNQQPDREHEQTTVGQVPDRHRPPVLAEAGVGLGLGGVLDVRVVQQVLGAEGEGGEEGDVWCVKAVFQFGLLGEVGGERGSGPGKA